jgi:hypothetical protein
MAHDIKTYRVRILGYSHPGEDFRRQAVLPGVTSPTPDEIEITIDHSLSSSDRDAYLRAEHAATNAARQWFPDGLPAEAVFRVEHDGLVLEVDLEMVPQYRARKPRT